MLGPMMQRLLEDRFHLKIHRETRDGPVYLLTVARGGPKLRQFQEGSCTPFAVPQPPLEPGKRYCGLSSLKIDTGGRSRRDARSICQHAPGTSANAGR